MRSWIHVVLVIIILTSTTSGFLSYRDEDPDEGAISSDADTSCSSSTSDHEVTDADPQSMDVISQSNELHNSEYPSNYLDEVNVQGDRSRRTFLDAFRLNFDPWDPKEGETVMCSASVHNYGTEGQIASNVNVEFYYDDEYISTDLIDEIQPGDNGTAWAEWKAVNGSHTMKIIADPDGSDGGPDEHEATLNVNASNYSPRLQLLHNASWIKNADTNHYYIKVTNQGTNPDTISLDSEITRYGNDPGGWTISLDSDEVDLDGGESTYSKLSVDYTNLGPDYTAEAVVRVTAESQHDQSKECSLYVTTSVIHDTPILFVDDDGQHEFKGVNDPMLPGQLIIDTGAWGGSYGANSDHLMNSSLDSLYKGLWEYVALPGDVKQGKWVNNNTMGTSGPVFNSDTPGYDPADYPYQDTGGDDIFLEDYDVVIWNLGYSEGLTAHPNGSDEPRSTNDEWWDQNETAKYLRSGGNLWLTGNAMSFYFDRYATIEGEVTNQWLREYFHVEQSVHAVGLKPQIMGVTQDPIGNGIDATNGNFYGDHVVGGERGNVATDWTPMQDAHGVIYGNGKQYSTVRYEHPRESSQLRRFKTVLQSGGFENFGDWTDLDAPMRLKLVQQTLTWLGVPPAVVPEYDVGMSSLDQPMEDFLEPGKDVPLLLTLKNVGQKDITVSFDLKFRVNEVGGSLQFQKTQGVTDDIPIGESLDIQTNWSSNRPEAGKVYEINVTLENPGFDDGNDDNNLITTVKTSRTIVDIGVERIWHDMEDPWNATLVGHDTTFHAMVQNHGSAEKAFDVIAIIFSPLGTIVYEKTTLVTLIPGHSRILNWTWKPRNPGGLISGFGGGEGDVSDPYVLNISVSVSGDRVSANDGKELGVVVMAFFDGSELTFLLKDWTPIDLSDHDPHGNDDELTPWHLSDEWAMSGTHAWKASNSQGQLQPDWNTCIISPKISLQNFTDTRINNLQSGQLGGSCFLELSLNYDGNPAHVEAANWTQIWSRSYQAQATWMAWEASDLNEYLDEEFYLRYRLTTSERNDVGWFVDDLVITGIVRNYTMNDIGVSVVSIDPLIDEKEMGRDIAVTVVNFGENRTNYGGRPGFYVKVTIEDEGGEEVYNKQIFVPDELGIGDTVAVTFDYDNGKDWVPKENGIYQISAMTIWEDDGKSIDENPRNDIMVIDGVVQFEFFNDDMESGVNEWDTDGHPNGWALGTPSEGPTPHSGSNCWGTNLAGNYPDLNDNSLILEHRIDLRTTSDPVLSVWHWLEVENDVYDTAYVEARTTDQSQYSTLWTNPSSERQGYPYRTDGWEIITLDLDDFAYHEVIIRFRLQTDGDVNYLGWYIDDLSVEGSVTPSYDAMVFSIDYPTGGENIAPSETIEIVATIMNVGLNQDVIPVTCKVIRQGANPVVYDLGEQRTDVLDPGEKMQVAFNWQLPIGTYQYEIEVRTELEDDGNSENDELVLYFWAYRYYDISILSVHADPMIQDVARTRHVMTEVWNRGNSGLFGNIEITFEAIYKGETIDEYSTMISLERGEMKEVSWEWQSFKYGEYTIIVYGSIFDETDRNPADNMATLGDIITKEIFFSDTREDDESPAYLDRDSGEFTIWDWEREGVTFWTGDNETDPLTPGWHAFGTGHFSWSSWYGGIPSKNRYTNNMRAELISEALNLENSTDVHLSFYTRYVIEGGRFDYIDISISKDRDDNNSWEQLLRYPDENQSHDSVLEPDSIFGWVHKDVIIPESYLTDSFYLKILMKTDNGITYPGVWIDDITIYGNSSGNHAPCARFNATYDQITDSYSRRVIQNPPLNLQQIKGDNALNNLPHPMGDEQGGIELGQEIQFSAELSFDPDMGDDIFNYMWFYGDGTTGNGKSVSHVYEGDLPLEGYFMVTLRVTDENDAFSEDTMLIWIGNKAPEADYIVTTIYDQATPISDVNDGVRNDLIDVFYGDIIIFQQASTDPERDVLNFQWEFRSDDTKFTTVDFGDAIIGVVGVDFLYEGLDGSDPILSVTTVDYTVTLFVSDGISISEISYTVRVHPYATAQFVKKVNLGQTLLDATVTLTWRGFPDEAAPAASYVSPDRPVFVYIDDTASSPDLNLANRGGIGKVYDISSVGCTLQNGEEGFVSAEIRIPILTLDLQLIGDLFILQNDIKLEYYDELEKRFVAIESSHVIVDGGVKYVVGEVEHFSIYTAILDSLYDPWNPNSSKMHSDLSVHSIELSRFPVLPGQGIEIRAQIRNIGVLHARNVGVTIYDGEHLIREVSLNIVYANGIWPVVKTSFAVSMIDPNLSYEKRIIKVSVNEHHSINEGTQNYMNNEKQAYLEVVSSNNLSSTPEITSPRNGKTVKGDVQFNGVIPDYETVVDTTFQTFGNNDFAWHIKSVDPNPVSIYSVNYILVDRNGSDVFGGQGHAHEIYGLNYDDDTTKFSFMDNDRNGMISPGDVFLVKNAANGGLAEEDHSLMLEFGNINMVGISIDNGEWITVSGIHQWNYTWDSTSVEDGKYSVSVRSSDGQNYSDIVTILVTVDQSSGEPGLLVYLLLLFMLGALSLILVSVMLATFETEP